MRKIIGTSALALCAVLALGSPAHAVNLVGQSINATLTSSVGTANFVQFASPQVVGAGTEFTGQFTDVFGQNWVIGVDVNATGFTLGIQDGPNGNVSTDAANGAILVNLSNLTGLNGLGLVSYSCTPPGFACNTSGGGPNILSSGSDATSAFVSLSTIRTGELYTFTLDAAVPEPASWALMISGFGLVGAASRRRARASVAFA